MDFKIEFPIIINNDNEYLTEVEKKCDQLVE